MKKVILFYFVMVMSCHLVGQIQTIDKIETEPFEINFGISLKMHSEVLNEERTIMISLPEGYDGSVNKYPVLYMLDAQWNFSHTVMVAGWLADKKIMPKTIVVGIHTGGENRTRDLVPSKNKKNGANKLHAFIKKELIPFIEKNYRTYNYRVLGGVSFGGLFVMHAFVRDPQLFNNYVSLSPSMWSSNGLMLTKTRDFLSMNPKLSNNLYLALANEGPQMGVDSLSKILEIFAPKELAWKFDTFPEEIHETINYNGLWNGLKFVFKDWYYPLVNFGFNGNSNSSDATRNSSTDAQKVVEIPENLLNKYDGLYVDSYGRLLKLIRDNKTLKLSGAKLPEVTIYPKSENEFFIKKEDIQNKFFLKGYDIQFKFSEGDSLIVSANGKTDCTAKKITRSPLVKLSEEVLNKYIGTYLIPGANNNMNIINEGGSLHFKDNYIQTKLYPQGENLFFAFINNEGYELEFEVEKANKGSKMILIKDGKKLFKAEKIK